MIKNEARKDTKTPEVKINRSLDQYRGKVIFKTTLVKAKNALKNVKLPEALGEKSA